MTCNVWSLTLNSTQLSRIPDPNYLSLTRSWSVGVDPGTPTYPT